MKAPTATLSLLALLAAGPAAADDPKSYACRFVEGVTHVYDKGQFAQEKAATLSFGIAAIDTRAQTAALQTDRGTGQLRVVRAVNALHFLEVATEGFLNVTTIYDKDEANGSYPAVHSRHFGVLGQPIITQYRGFCDAKG
jgi:hypothetical protein